VNRIMKSGKNDSDKSYLPKIPVVFLHAFPLNSRMWKPQIKFLEKHQIKYIAEDYPGFGKTPIIKNHMDILDYGEYIYEIVRDNAIEQAIFIGLSLGGYVAFSLLREHPEIFKGLLLANTRAAADNEEIRKKRLQIVQDLQINRNLSSIIETHLRLFFTKQTRQKKLELISDVMEIMKESNVEGVIQAQQAMAARPDSLQLLEEINFPVSIVSSEMDSLINPQETLQMARIIPEAHLEFIQKAAHLSNYEAPQEFNRVMSDLISRCA
jgi:3-oxoadipate enol-lactonase